jgi:PHD/YefM family antitoxin component YafN of YafNO toxin-antitoxin module
MARVLSEIRDEESPFFITKGGKAVAALLPIRLYDEILSALEDKLDEEDDGLLAHVREARRDYKAGRAVPLGKLKRLLGR